MLCIAQASVSPDRACMTLALCTHTAHDVSVQQLDSLLWPCLEPKAHDLHSRADGSRRAAMLLQDRAQPVLVGAGELGHLRA